MIPICDFCSSSQIAWRYPCKNFGVTAVMLAKNGDTVTFPWGSAGDWAACETCSAFIEADDWAGLAERSVETSPSYEMLRDYMVKGEVEKAVMKLHTQFRKFRQERMQL